MSFEPARAPETRAVAEPVGLVARYPRLDEGVR
jgi:hypothetical protein